MAPLPPTVEVRTERVHLDPTNFRQDYGNLDGLLDSIQRYGILQPPGLWHDKERGYFVIWGNRRVLSAKKLGMESISARVFPGPLDPGLADIYQLTENLQRVDLKPSEEASGYRHLMESQNWNGSELAGHLSVSNGTVTKKIALLKLVPALLAKVDSGELPETAGYELAHLAEDTQIELANRFNGRVTREEVKTAMQALGNGGGKGNPASKPTMIKRGLLSVSVRGDDIGLETYINDLQSMLREAKQAKDHGISTLADFAKALKTARMPA